MLTTRLSRASRLFMLYRGHPARRKVSTKLTQPFGKSFCTAAQHVTPAAVPQQKSVDDWRSNLADRDDSWLHGPRADSWWTGPPRPTELSSLPFQDLTKVTRADLKQYFDNSWQLTETLFSALQGEEAFMRPPYHDLRHPLIFYYGHPACFYVNKLRLAGLLDRGVDPYFESIFETGVDEMRWDDLSKNHMSWPSVAEVHAYRQEVYKVVCDVIMNAPGFETLGSELQGSPWWSVPMGFEHERIHIETSSVLMRELPLEFVSPPSSWPALSLSWASSNAPVAGKDFPNNSLIQLPTATATLGKSFDEVSYGWDNEYGSKAIAVGGFNASEMQISNGEFYEFVVSGGYRDPTLWSEDGWAWCCFRNIRKPTFWVEDGPKGLNQFKLRTVFTEEPMQWDWPVIANYHEAKAFCAWRSRKDQVSKPYRVLTEAEHWRLRETVGSEDPVMQDSNSSNFNLKAGAERAVDAGQPNSLGFHDVFGNAWEWCEDHQAPLPGFELHHLYDDFTLPCFDGEHHMIMGGSFVSTGDQASVFARYQFRPHFFQHASFRLSQPLSEPWLVTSCMDSPGPFARATSPYRDPAEHMAPPAYLTSQEPPKTSDSPLPNLEKRVESFSAQPEQKQTQADYEQDEWVSRYLNLHFPAEGAAPEWIPEAALNFPARCGDKLIQTADRLGVNKGNVLDLGCGVGGAAFTLADRDRGYGSVTGLEYSHSFVDVCNQLKFYGQLEYDLRLEGDQHEKQTAVVPANTDADRLEFLQGDACHPESAWQRSYDAILLGNLLCRLPKPRGVLYNMSRMVTPGGLLMLTSPFSWKPEFCPREEWLGGLKSGMRGSEAVAETMDQVGFDAVEAYDMPLVIRHHARFYELIGAHATLWQKRRMD